MRAKLLLLILLLPAPALADVQEECKGYANLTRIVVNYRLEGVEKEVVTEIMQREFNTPPAFQPTIDWIYITEIPNKPLVDIVVYNHFFHECVSVGGPPK